MAIALLGVLTVQLCGGLNLLVGHWAGRWSEPCRNFCSATDCFRSAVRSCMHRGGTGEQACAALADGQPLSHGGQAFLDSAQCCGALVARSAQQAAVAAAPPTRRQPSLDSRALEFAFGLERWRRVQPVSQWIDLVGLDQPAGQCWLADLDLAPWAALVALASLCCGILAGSLGNGIDRWRYGAVIDGLELVPFSFPVFNLADVAINLAVLCW